MDHAQTRRLARFCADQYFVFEPGAWAEFAAATDASMLAAAARYLCLTSWYGREVELARIAAGLVEEAQSDTRTTAAAQGRGFDLEYFSGVLRIEVATRRLSAAGPRHSPPPRSSEPAG